MIIRAHQHLATRKRLGVDATTTLRASGYSPAYRIWSRVETLSGELVGLGVWLSPGGTRKQRRQTWRARMQAARSVSR